MIYRKAFYGFSPALLRGFSAASSLVKSGLSFQGGEGAAQNLEKQACFHTLSIYGGLGFACFSCYFNGLALTAPAQRVRY